MYHEITTGFNIPIPHGWEIIPLGEILIKGDKYLSGGLTAHYYLDGISKGEELLWHDIHTTEQFPYENVNQVAIRRKLDVFKVGDNAEDEYEVNSRPGFYFISSVADEIAIETEHMQDFIDFLQRYHDNQNL